MQAEPCPGASTHRTHSPSLPFLPKFSKVLLQKPPVVPCPTKPSSLQCFLFISPTYFLCLWFSVTSWFFIPTPTNPSISFHFPFHFSHLPAPQFLFLLCLLSVLGVSPLTLPFFVPFQTISYDVFKLFMRAYLEVDLPQPLSTHLFLAFSQKPRQEVPDHPKEGTSNSEASAPGKWISILWKRGFAALTYLPQA